MSNNNSLPEGIIKNSYQHVNWLMQRRIEILALWPCAPNDYQIGATISVSGGLLKIIEILEHGNHTIPYTTTIDDALTMPHLFKEISWWEKRSKEQMPEYIKVNLPINGNKIIRKIDEWNNETTIGITPENTFLILPYSKKDIESKRYLPATEDEYLEYTASKQD